MDLLLKIIAAQDPLSDNPTQTLEWLCTTELIPSLVKKMDSKNPENSEEIIENACQALVDIITASNAFPKSPLIDQLESNEVALLILQYVLDNGYSPTLLHGLSVLVHLLQRHGKTTSDEKTTQGELPTLLKYVVQNLTKFKNFLDQPKGNGKEEETTNNNNNNNKLIYYHSTVGDVVSLGFHRLRLIEFFGSLVGTNFQAIDSLMVSQNIFTKCFQMFFEYPWNNFLHHSVLAMVDSIYGGKHDKLKITLITECKLLDLMCDGIKENEEEQKKPNGLRKGYMGHVTKISAILIESSKDDANLTKLLNEHQRWQEYVNGALKETQAREVVAAEYLAHQASLQQQQQQQQQNQQTSNDQEEQYEDRIDTTTEDS